MLEGQTMNRISQYYNNQDMNKFLHVEFEKFDPRIIQNVIKQNNEEDEEEYNDSGYGGQESSSHKIIVSQDSQMLQTLNLWIGHCNVGITNKLVELIENVDGVETLDIISKYRFRVGIGKLFEEKKVKTTISDTINEYVKPTV